MEPPDLISFESGKDFVKSQREQKVDNYIELMSWAFANRDEYAYNRALKAMLNLLMVK